MHVIESFKKDIIENKSADELYSFEGSHPLCKTFSTIPHMNNSIKESKHPIIRDLLSMKILEEFSNISCHLMEDFGMDESCISLYHDMSYFWSDLLIMVNRELKRPGGRESRGEFLSLLRDRLIEWMSDEEYIEKTEQEKEQLLRQVESMIEQQYQTVTKTSLLLEDGLFY